MRSGYFGFSALRYGLPFFRTNVLSVLAPSIFTPNIPSDRHQVLFTYLAEPLTNFTVRSVMRYESDPRVLRDFFEDEYRSNPQQPTFVEANQLGENFSVDGCVQPRVNNFFETVERLPEVNLT